MPPLPKHPGRRQRRNVSPAGLALAAPPPDRPAPPLAIRRALKVTQEAWETYWHSPVAGVADESDIPALRRLFSLYDERERAMRSYQAHRMVEVERHQGFNSWIEPTINPFLMVVARFDPEIRQLEDSFGLSPRARLRLGIQLGEAAKTLADLTGPMGDDDEDADPRLANVIDASPPADARPAGM